MKELTLDGCGITLDLETFKLLAKGHPSHNAWSMVSQEYGSINWNHTPGTMQSSFTLSLKNTDFSEKAIENLRRSRGGLFLPNSQPGLVCYQKLIVRNFDIVRACRLINVH